MTRSQVSGSCSEALDAGEGVVVEASEISEALGLAGRDSEEECTGVLRPSSGQGSDKGAFPPGAHGRNARHPGQLPQDGGADQLHGARGESGHLHGFLELLPRDTATAVPEALIGELVAQISKVLLPALLIPGCEA